MIVRPALRLLAAFVCVAGLAIASETTGIWLDVPFVPQQRDGCGAAAISMVMQYWSNKQSQTPSPGANPEKIQAALFSSADRGVPAPAMEQYFRKSGFQTFAFRGEWVDLQQHISKGRPLIVSLKASGPKGPFHYVVVAGLDSERGYVFLNDPAQRKLLRVSREVFEAEWSPSGNWTLLALPWPGE